MTTVFTNASFISLDSDGGVYSVMVVSSKRIVYVGYNTPVCYDSARVVDLNGGYVIPLVNDMVYYDTSGSDCRVLAQGERADFIVVNGNVLNKEKVNILEVYKKGRKIV